MSKENRIGGSALRLVAVCALAMSGCAATLVPTAKLHDSEFADVMGGPLRLGGHRVGMQVSPECACGADRQRLQDYAHHALPYVGGPFMHRHGGTEYAADQATIQPPHSKFHPVPTRPVFEPQAAYLPPQPMGVQLVPVPDQEWQLMEESGLDDAGTLLLSPPST